MKLKLILAIITSNIFVGCATNEQGEKTFLNRTTKQWGDIGFNSGKRAAPIILEEYKNSESTSSK